MLRLATTCLLFLLASCAGLNSRSSQRSDAAAPQFALDSPSALRAASFTAGVRYVDAAEYETTLPSSQVTINGTTLEFAAVTPYTTLSDLAYCMYALDATGYAGQGIVGVDWVGGAPQHGVWLGIANWVSDQWELQPVPVGEEVNLGIYTEYVHPVDGRVLLMVLSTRDTMMTLDKVYFGVPGLNPPVNVAASDDTFTDKVQITWDAPNTGPFPEGYTIWRSDTELGIYTEIGSTTFQTTYDDFTVVLDTPYWYKVKATKSGLQDSEFSAANEGRSSAGGAGWTIVTASTYAVQDPQQLSLALVSGNPAIAYSRPAGGYSTYYTRAQDTSGATWGGALMDLTATAQDPSLGYFNGVPCIAGAGTGGTGDIKFSHATEANGDQPWAAWINAFDSASQHIGGNPDLFDVGGRPAIAFTYSDFENFTGTELCFIRSSDGAGDNWPATRVVVDSGERAYNPQMALLANGNPAILFVETDNQGSDNATILYTRATNSVGSAWAPPVEVYDLGDQNTIANVQLIIADGVPAAFFHDGAANSDSVYYKRADNAEGTSWPVGATNVADTVDFYDGAATVNGKPAFTYIADGGSDIMYREAIDTSGNSWLPAELVEEHPGGTGLATLKGFGAPEHACIAFRVNGSEIRFARRN